MWTRRLVFFGIPVLVFASMVLRAPNVDAGVTPDLLVALDLDEEGIAQPIASSRSGTEDLLRYDAKVDYLEIGGQWTMAIEDAGYERIYEHTTDLSQRIIEYSDGTETLMFVLSDDVRGPTVTFGSTTDPGSHWALTGSDVPSVPVVAER